MFHMLSTTFASPVNIQHVPTIARSRGQHVVNICSSHPPSDGLAHESVENQAGEAQKSLKIVQKSLKIARFFLLAPMVGAQLATFSTFARPQAGSTFNIVVNICSEWCQHFNINSCSEVVNVFLDGYICVPGAMRPVSTLRSFLSLYTPEPVGRSNL